MLTRRINTISCAIIPANRAYVIILPYNMHSDIILYYNIIYIYIGAEHCSAAAPTSHHTRKYGEYFLNYAKLYNAIIITLCACGWAGVSVCTIRDIVSRNRI